MIRLYRKFCNLLIIILILGLIMSLFPLTMFIHAESSENIDYVSAEEYVEVSNEGYQDPLLDSFNVSFVQNASYQPYFVETESNKIFYNGYDQQMYGNHVKKVIDISEHNGYINFEALKDSGVDGVIIRAGWGAGGVDQYFDYNIKECNRLKIPYGLYLSTLFNLPVTPTP